MPDAKPDSKVQQGTEIPPPEVGKVADWLFNKSNYLRQVVAAATSWLNFSVIVKIKNPDGTTTALPRIKPVIVAKDATMTIPLDFSALSQQMKKTKICVLVDGVSKQRTAYVFRGDYFQDDDDPA